MLFILIYGALCANLQPFQLPLPCYFDLLASDIDPIIRFSRPGLQIIKPMMIRRMTYIAMFTRAPELPWIPAPQILHPPWKQFHFLLLRRVTADGWGEEPFPLVHRLGAWDVTWKEQTCSHQIPALDAFWDWVDHRIVSDWKSDGPPKCLLIIIKHY